MSVRGYHASIFGSGICMHGEQYILRLGLDDIIVWFGCTVKTTEERAIRIIMVSGAFVQDISLNPGLSRDKMM